MDSLDDQGYFKKEFYSVIQYRLQKVYKAHCPSNFNNNINCSSELSKCSWISKLLMPFLKLLHYKVKHCWEVGASATLSSNKVKLKLKCIKTAHFQQRRVTEPSNTSHTPLCLHIKIPTSS